MFDAFSFGRQAAGDRAGLAFSNLILSMSFNPQTPQQPPVFSFDASNLAIDMAASTPRPHSLFQHLPLTVAGITQAQQGSAPTDLGFMGVQTPLSQSALTFPWFSLNYNLNLGTPGALAAAAGFVASLTVAWSPAQAGGGYKVFLGLKLPGSSGAKRSIPIEGLFDISFKSLQIVCPEPDTFVLVLYGIGFSFFSFTFPPSGQVNFALFGDPSAQGKGDTSLGWYAAYAKSGGSSPSGGGNGKALTGAGPKALESAGQDGTCMRVLVWNILSFTLTRINDNTGANIAQVMDSADKSWANTNYILATLQQADPDIFVVIEARSSQGPIAQLAGGNGPAGLLYLLGQMREQLSPNWYLVPPLRVNPQDILGINTHTETVGVFWRDDRLQFTGPMRWPAANNAHRAADRARAALPPRTTRRHGTRPSRSVLRPPRCAGSTRAATRLLFNDAAHRRPYLTTFLERNAPGRNMNLFSVHFKPGVNAQTASARLSDVPVGDAAGGEHVPPGGRRLQRRPDRPDHAATGRAAVVGTGLGQLHPGLAARQRADHGA